MVRRPAWIYLSKFKLSAVVIEVLALRSWLTCAKYAGWWKYYKVYYMYVYVCVLEVWVLSSGRVELDLGIVHARSSRA
ncbi:hypothetical protein DFP73DRAFT_546271 [Morchella snyderi]|nr:hypothetical protein DFP73DRAFT_546271 [Morchella snyderi]